jgi:hypothetical protein
MTESVTAASDEEVPDGAVIGITCSALFARVDLAGTALQDAVFASKPLGDCESVSISGFSPGPVSDSETLTKLILHPIHVDPVTGQISPMAFQDATTLDLSLFREQMAENSEIQLAIDQIRATGASKVPPQDRLLQLVMQATAEDIRGLRFDDNNERMCFVYDTGECDKPHHASVFTPTSARKGSRQRQVRKKLFELFSLKIVPLESYRSLAFEEVS